jgi:NAD-dependent deacetylase
MTPDGLDDGDRPWRDPGGAARWDEAVAAMRAAGKAVALSGAGISVESGIPDFRSPGGVWDRFPVEEYGTIETFLLDPDKAWDLFRAIWDDVEGAEPNPAHVALAHLEEAGRLAGVVTQNIDGLHQAGGSRVVHEIHGDCRRLQCIRCAWLGPVRLDEIRADPRTPRCPECGEPVKPNVVVFGEAVRGFEGIAALVEGADVILVIGTSATVHPASMLPRLVADRGGTVIEFNLEPTDLTFTTTDCLVRGPAGTTLPAFVEAVLD